MTQNTMVWESKETEFDSVDLKGRHITLGKVPAEHNKEKGITRVRIEDILKAEQEYIAKEHGVNPRNIAELNLLHASFPPFFEAGAIDHKFRFNKMLFYHWKEMEKIGYGDSLIFDEFVSQRAGPIPKHLRDDIKELREKGLVEVVAVKDGKKIAEGKEAMEKCCKTPGISMGCRLTSAGMKVAKSIWDNTPDDIKERTTNVKKDLFFVDSTQLKEKVHAKYPEFRKTYTEPDTE